MENKKNLINVLIIIASIVSAVLTIKFALGIVERMIDSNVGILQNNPMPLIVCLTVGGGISFFLLGKIKKIFALIGVYYIGIIITGTCFCYALLAYLFNVGLEYVFVYTFFGIMLFAITNVVAKTFK